MGVSPSLGHCSNYIFALCFFFSLQSTLSFRTHSRSFTFPQCQFQNCGQSKFFQKRIPCSKLCGRYSRLCVLHQKHFLFREQMQNIYSLQDGVTTAGDQWIAEICEDVEGLSAWTGIYFLVKEDTYVATDSSRW